MTTHAYSGSADNMRILREEAARLGASDATLAFLSTTMFAESGGRATACATTSSAKGLFQFIDSTWNSVCANHGLDASQRFDARTQCDAAIALAQENAQALTSILGHTPTSGQLYLAHFLGTTGAKKLFAEAAHDPSQTLGQILPTAAHSNASVANYTLNQLQAWADRKMGVRIDQRFAYQDLRNAHQTTAEQDAAELAERKRIFQNFGISDDVSHTMGLDKPDSILGELFFDILKLFIDSPLPSVERAPVVDIAANQTHGLPKSLPARGAARA